MPGNSCPGLPAESLAAARADRYSHHQWLAPRYLLTYDVPHHPSSPESLRRFLREQLLPAVAAQLKEQQVNSSFYGNFDRQHTQWLTFGYEPRYSTSISVCAGGWRSWRSRTRMPRTSNALRPRGASSPPASSSSPNGATRFTRSCGRPGSRQSLPVASRVPVTSCPSATGRAYPEKIVVEGYEQPPASPSAASESTASSAGTPPRERPKDYRVEYLGDYQATASVSRPFAYVVPRELSRVAARLHMHGIELQQVSAPFRTTVEIHRITKLKRETEPFQQHRLLEVEVETRREPRDVPGGDYLIVTAQPLGNLAIQLLEPAAVDSLCTWNFFDPELRTGRDYPVVRLVEPVSPSSQRVTRIEPLQELTLDQLYGTEGQVNFTGSSSSVHWLAGSDDYEISRDGRRLQEDAETGGQESYEPLRGLDAALQQLPGIDQATARRLSREHHPLSSDRRGGLITLSDDLYYFDTASRQARRLTNTAAPERLATFSPDGTLVAFVPEHNLHVLEVASGTQRALTTEGSAELLHGELDWVYQEELYGRGNYRNYWWSPDSQSLALLRLDQRPVHSYTVTDHEPYRQNLEVTRYPKAGDPIPVATLGVARARGGPIRWVEDTSTRPKPI